MKPTALSLCLLISFFITLKSHAIEVTKDKLTTFYHITLPNIHFIDRGNPTNKFLCELDSSGSIVIPDTGKYQITKKTTAEDIKAFIISKQPKIRTSKITVKKVQYALKEYNPQADTKIRGEIERPINLKVGKKGMKLKEVLKHFKPTEMAAMNRIQVIRNSKMYIYSVSIETHRDVQLFPGDSIQIPIKSFYSR